MWSSASAEPSSSSSPHSNNAKPYPSSFAYPPTPPVEMKMEANNHAVGNSDYLNSGGALPGMNDLHRHHSPTDAMAFSAYSAIPSSSPSSVAGKKFHEGTQQQQQQQMSVEQSLEQQQSHDPQHQSPTTIAAVSASTAYPYFAAAPSADLSSPLYGSYANPGVFAAAGKGASFTSSSGSSSAAAAAGIKQSPRSKTSRSNAGKRSSVIGY